jgi:hypothetical protein
MYQLVKSKNKTKEYKMVKIEPDELVAYSPNKLPNI